MVGVNVGTMLSTVEVEIRRGGMVGSGVDVDATAGGVPVQAASINKRTGRIFFNVYKGRGNPPMPSMVMSAKNTLLEWTIDNA